MVTLIVAMTGDGAIGSRKMTGLPWRLPEDLRHFRDTTRDGVLVMGRRTWDSLPRKPLPGRPHVVLTGNLSWQPYQHAARLDQNRLDGATPETDWPVIPVCSAHAALSACLERWPEKQVFVCGGAATYRSFLELDLVHRMLISVVDSTVIDEPVMFPSDAVGAGLWSEPEELVPTGHSFRLYERRRL